MDFEQINSLARMLVEAHGEQAEAAAARRQTVEERKGNDGEAENWKRVLAALQDLSFRQ